MDTIPLGLYLWKRVREIGIQSVFGLPGDFNLRILDYIDQVEELNWVGNSNELNAAYAADGYARVKKVPGCIITTHGVGELSAINGVAGAASESIPMIHIVGQTARFMQQKQLMIHHSIDPSDHQVYNKMSKYVRCAAAELWDPQSAPDEIDLAIRKCLVLRKPVYIFFPIDLHAAPVPAKRLNWKISAAPSVDCGNQSRALKAILAQLYTAKHPSVFVDALTRTHGADHARQLVDKLAFPTFSSNMGKSIIDETKSYYVGVYNGKVSFQQVIGAIDKSDVVLTLGWFSSDTNTGAFTRDIPVDKRIDIMPDHAVVDGVSYQQVYMEPLLQALIKDIDTSRLPKVPIPTVAPWIPDLGTSERITQNGLWSSFQAFLREGDVLVSETGTALFGLSDLKFPTGTFYITQANYGSIGYATPAAYGAELALKEMHQANNTTPRRRTVLVTGDGSLQLSVQEIGSMIMRGVKPVIVILNNNGYTIERAIHGARQSYNDIAPYNYPAMLSFFGAKNADKCFRRVETMHQLEAALNEESLKNPQQVQVLEVCLDKMDIPWRLAEMLCLMDGGVRSYLVDEGFTNVDTHNGSLCNGH